jgi:4-amino-4-deoxy-L-arabinose transferase-like glycosyltransferase
MLKLTSVGEPAHFKRFGYLIIALATVFVLFFWHLAALAPRLSLGETIYKQSVQSLSGIMDNPIYLPHKLLSFLLIKIGNGSTSIRLASVIMSLIFIASFYIVCRRWFGQFIALATTILFTSIPWIILYSRSGTPEIMLLSPLVLLAAFLWFSKTDKKTIAFFLLILLTGVLLYVPGMIWFVVVAGAFLQGKVSESSQELSKKIICAGGVLLVLLLVPLALAISKNTAVLKSILLIPTSFHGAKETVSSISWSIGSLVWKTRQHSYLSVGRLSILNATNMILALFGIYIMWTKARREFYALIFLFIFGIVASGLNENVAFLILSLPSIGILMAAGLRYLYGEWRTVFPLNPLPKTLALALICSLVLLNLYVGIRYSLITWPHSLPAASSVLK